jgi:uncharacterized membrane protein YbhN (UPF0104 family)
MWRFSNRKQAMDKLVGLFRTKWGALVLWVLVMYLTALLWNVMDDDSWFAFPTYVISVLAWICSFLYVARFFFEWTGTGIRPRPPQPAQADRSEPE